MCGIAGYIGDRDIDRAVVRSCLALMCRRGPDSSGYYRHVDSRGSNVLLLSTRLKIIDLDDKANQPFSAGPDVIVYNGELYNYVELRSILNGKGVNFRTASDTEVLLNMIRIYGLQALPLCEGMWAFAHYSESDEVLTLSRDRFGEKPLYTYRDDTGIYFGSEIKFISALVGNSPEIDYEHLYRYMVNGYKALYKKNNSFYSNVFELDGATSLTIDSNGKEDRRKYWEPFYNPNEDMSYEEAVEGVRDRLLNAVELRLRADVPIAFCMSGGVDSNSLISIAKKVFGYDVHGFTIHIPDERYNEQDLVEYSVRSLGIRHSSIVANPHKFLPQLEVLINQHDAPVHTINYFAHWLLMGSISDHGYSISVSGTGADELFTGYYDHHLSYLHDVRGDSLLHESAKLAWAKHILPEVRNPFLRDPDLFIHRPDFRDHIFLDAAEFSGCLKNGWGEGFEEQYFSGDLLRNRMLNEMFSEIVPPILHEDDLNAMYYSIENRTPFLDTDLFEFSYTIPTKHLIRDGFTKIILRDAMSGIVPNSILSTRKKIGFNAPIFSFLDIRDPEVMSYLLDDSPIFEHVFRSRIEEMLSGRKVSEAESKFLFYFLNSKIFLENNIA